MLRDLWNPKFRCYSDSTYSTCSFYAALYSISSCATLKDISRLVDKSGNSRCVDKSWDIITWNGMGRKGIFTKICNDDADFRKLARHDPKVFRFIRRDSQGRASSENSKSRHWAVMLGAGTYRGSTTEVTLPSSKQVTPTTPRGVVASVTLRVEDRAATRHAWY